tara:strand:+ start:474 stop:1391 length:918 start_codon:yes stop_codon:yes gene_type:complete
MLKTVSSVTNAIGALNYKGTWNANTNMPTLASGVGTKGDYYVVSVAGSTNLDGQTLWGVGDWAVFNGSVWERLEGGSTINATTVTASGAITGANFNKTNITAPATASTLTIADGKTLTASNTLTLAGTDSTTMTFPATNASIARTDAAQTFTGNQTISGNLLVGTTTSRGVTTASSNSGATNAVSITKSASGVSIGNGGTITISSFLGVGLNFFGTIYITVIGAAGYDNITRMYAVTQYTNGGGNDQYTLTALTSAAGASGGQGGTMTNITADLTGGDVADLTVTITTSTTENRTLHAVFVGSVV